MIAAGSGLSLDEGMTRAGLSWDQLWLRHVSVGGTADELELEAYVLGLLVADPYQHDVIAQALNEYFTDHGENHPVGYWSGTPR